MRQFVELLLTKLSAMLSNAHARSQLKGDNQVDATADPSSDNGCLGARLLP